MAITSSNIHDGELNNPLDDRYVPVYATIGALPDVTTEDNGRLAAVEANSGVYQVSGGAWVFRGFLGVEGSGGGGGGSWGGITGDLSDQADLVAALALKATSAQGQLADSAMQPGADADALGSGTATDGQVLTADGAGGAAWEDAASGGGGGVGHDHDPEAPTELTTSRALTADDHNKVLYYDGASPIAVTLPSTAEDGFECAVINSGSSTVTFQTQSTDTKVPAGFSLDNSGASELTIVSILHNDGVWYGIYGERVLESFVVALSDESSDLTTGAGKASLHWPYDFVITDLIGSVGTAAVGAAVEVDMNVEGATILSTKLTIDSTEDTSETSATPAVFTSTTISKGDKVTWDVNQVGSSTAGKGLKVAVVGYRP